MQGFGLILYYGILAAFGFIGIAVIYGGFGGRRAGLGIGIGMLTVGLLFALALGRSQVRLAVFGAHAEGRITEIYQVRGGIQPIVEYTTADETPITFDGATVGKRDYYDLRQKVHVRYLPSDPHFAEIQSWWSLWQPLLIGVFTTSAILTGGGLLVWRDWRRHW